ncbi:MAG TPA: hypothetical protein VNR37_11595 [Microbacteriaceae bacterium]|nr:hypothetical protein [Microbacteriaceae bacterium]
MRETDAVWRTLGDAALSGRREWKSTGDLAWEAGVGEKLAYKALRRPVSIGAVTRYPGGGFSVTDPERVITLLAAARSLTPTHATSFEAAQQLVKTLPAYAIGGTRAAAHHLGGNRIADHATAIMYVPSNADLSFLPRGEGALVFPIDPHTLAAWNDGYTSKAQTYADLFAEPGWQASEFRRALWRAWFAIDDWARAEARHG